MAYSERILDAITGPSDLKCLTDDELEILCTELREEMITVTSQNGGHLASSLGAVETIVALHSLMDCPRDRIVFDVGHQAYAHKLLTGRAKDFSTLRQFGGITGFPTPLESEYDVHPSGHASDSLRWRSVLLWRVIYAGTTRRSSPLSEMHRFPEVWPSRP